MLFEILASEDCHVDLPEIVQKVKQKYIYFHLSVYSLLVYTKQVNSAFRAL